jgi:LysM repeat protein
MHHTSVRLMRRATLGLLTSGTAVGVALLLLVTRGTLATARAPGADGSALLAALALGCAWFVAGRLTLLTLAALAALVPGVVGRAAGRVAIRLAPALLRQAVVVVVGASAVLPAAGGPASAAPGPPGLPRLDRVVSWPAAASEPVPRPVAPPGAMSPGAVVVVAPGDTLWAIAAAHLPPTHGAADVARAWPRWYVRNRPVVGPDPALLRPGERLVAPADDPPP